MDIEEARQFIHNRFGDTKRSVWRHQLNEDAYQELLKILEPYVRLELAVSILGAAFWTAIDEAES